MTDLSKSQLNTILSALDGKQRNPNTKDAARKAIARHGEKLGLTTDDILAAAGGLVDGRIGGADFLKSLHDKAFGPAEAKSERESEKGTEAISNPGPSARMPRTRPNTKQAILIGLLRRPEGATVEQIAEATGWQNHSVRGAIAGALKKKLGLTITTERVRSIGPNKEGARGSYTVYRLCGAPHNR